MPDMLTYQVAQRQQEARKPPVEANRELIAQLLMRHRQKPGPMAEGVGRALLGAGVGMLPGAGDVMAAQDSQRAGQSMVERFRAGDYGGAAGAGLEALGHGLGALPMIPALGGMVKVFHGSPHRFDKFSLDKIGTGEGAQAYGHGLYFAENPAVAGSYKTAGRGALGGANPVPFLDGKPINWDEIGDDASIAIQSIDDPLVGANVPEKVAALREHGMAGAADWLEKNHGRIKMNSGALYNVALDVEPEDLLDWDAPLSQQSEKVRKALEGRIPTAKQPVPMQRGNVWSVGNNQYIMKDLSEFLVVDGSSNVLSRHKSFAEAAGAVNQDITGADIYRSFGSPEAASRALAEAGIPGLRYFDGGSRGSGDGTRNVVMFRDDLISIEGVE